MLEKIDHIGIVVKDLEKAIQVYSEVLGLEARPIEIMSELNLKLCFLVIGEVMIELIQPTGPGMYQDFINKHGEGMHHICYKVKNIDKALKRVVKKHLLLRDKKSRPGGGKSKIAFLDPKTIFNTETEFVERV